ncbi:hypothetical protein BDA96_06G244900 [Sorghum bicolor]|uniref:Uncharacterized protein n=1 Tax=Sorghum bicolor TaxID=4558 RepID=A0A921QVM1_SORBI|nr:hypothetical protein BDA96_06G244900 [Sorghum bicolor]
MEKINKKIYKCHSFLKKYKRHSQSEHNFFFCWTTSYPAQV